MLIVGLNGSPNADGNTTAMLQAALGEAERLGAETRLVQISELIHPLKMPFCVVCSNPCDGSCYRGTPLKAFFDQLDQVDGLLVGSPVYFGSVSAQLKAFFDKTRMVRAQKKLLNVVGGALAVGASRFGGQELTLRAIHDQMLVHGMIVIGDGYGDDDCGHHGAAAQRPAAEDEFGLKRARILGKHAAELAAATQALRRR